MVSTILVRIPNYLNPFSDVSMAGWGLAFADKRLGEEHQHKKDDEQSHQEQYHHYLPLGAGLLHDHCYFFLYGEYKNRR